jgi:hypothetical protein
MSLLEKLSKKEFDNKEIDWVKGRWAGIEVEIAQTDKNYFYKQGNEVFVQHKQGSGKDLIPYCYNCESEAKIMKVTVPIWDGNFLCSGSGEIKTKYSFYCESCNKNPPTNTEILTIDIPK